MKLVALTAASFVSTGAVVSYAFYRNQQFYPAMVYLVKSSPSLAILYAQAFVFVILLAKILRKVFFGQLRAAETEHLMERSWYAITETCLAFTVFREDFNFWFVAMFTLLLFLKGFHWLAEDRIDYMERSPVITWLFHVRALSLLVLLGTVDAMFIHHAYHVIVTQGVSVQIVFGFEYAILLTLAVNALSKYALHTIDLQSENPWENKAVYMLYLDFFLGFVRVVLYFAFVGIMIKVHTFPLFSIRPMYMALRAFRKSLSDVILSRRAIANMNTLYPDATAEELAESDVCIICREEMAGEGCKKLPCDHIFHANCLRSWFQRQQTCPTCRMDVLRQPVSGQAQVGEARAQRGRQDRQQQRPQTPAAQRQPLGGAPAPAANVPQPPFGLWPPHQPPFFPPGFPAGNVPGPNVPGPNAPAPAPAPAPNAAVPAGHEENGDAQIEPTDGEQQNLPDLPEAGSRNGAVTATEEQPLATATSTEATKATATIEELRSATDQQPAQIPGQGPMAAPMTGVPFMPSPFMFPPPSMFGFPPIPMGFPPVPAFPLSTLTDEQLQELEGRERANVEARITLLRNIHSLLDTAIAQLHYYSQAAAVNTGVSPPVDLSSTSLSPEDEAVRVVASEEVPEMETSMEGASVDSDVHELRQRRLSRFDSSPASVNRQNSNLQDETEEGNSG